MKKNIPSRVLEGIADLVETYGHSANTIAARVGLEPEALYRPDLMLSARTINDLLEEAALVCGDRFFSVKLARLQGWDVLGPIWLLIRRA
ncbi:MAG: AraC family transcriptional regulator ligand-binding domain-containing protein, partial [Pseudomonadales bacterium]